MTDIQAAIGLHQLRKLPEFHRRRQEIAGRYDRAFREFEELETPIERDWAGHAWHLYVLRLHLDRLRISRDEFVTGLCRRNIGTSVHFIPVHLFTYYRDRYRYSPEDFPVAFSEFQRIVSLLSRIFNLVCCATGLLALSALLVLIAFAIKCDDGGPVFYFQRRVGREFQPFRLVKFRTMRLGADRAGRLTAPSDPRVTRCGRLLRRYKLDELPQLWNVIQGDMQLVGSRPEVEAYVCQFRDQYSVLLSEPPGITDPASLLYRQEEEIFVSGQMERQYVSQILPEKLRLSLEYQHRRCLSSDFRILLETILHSAS